MIDKIKPKYIYNIYFPGSVNKLHKNKLNRESYAKRKALLNKSIESKKDYVYKPRKEKAEVETKPKKKKEKK